MDVKIFILFLEYVFVVTIYFECMEGFFLFAWSKYFGVCGVGGGWREIKV